MVLMEFWEWMNKQYVDWRGDSRATISEFAEYVGVRQPVMSKWMNRGGTIPGASSLAKIASKLGLEVYDVLGLPRPTSISKGQLPSELQSAIDAAIRIPNISLPQRQDLCFGVLSPRGTPKLLRHKLPTQKRHPKVSFLSG